MWHCASIFSTPSPKDFVNSSTRWYLGVVTSVTLNQAKCYEVQLFHVTHAGLNMSNFDQHERQNNSEDKVHGRENTSLASKYLR